MTMPQHLWKAKNVTMPQVVLADRQRTDSLPRGGENRIGERGEPQRPRLSRLRYGSTVNLAYAKNRQCYTCQLGPAYPLPEKRGGDQ